MSTPVNAPMVDIWRDMFEKYPTGDVKLPTSALDTATETPNRLPPRSGSIGSADNHTSDAMTYAMQSRQIGKTATQELVRSAISGTHIVNATKGQESITIDMIRKEMEQLGLGSAAYSAKRKARKWIENLPATQEELDELTLPEMVELVRTLPIDGLRRLSHLP